MKTQLLSQRLLLRKPVFEDASRIFERYGQDSEVTRYLSWKPHKNIEDSLNFIRRLKSTWGKGQEYAYLIEEREGNRVAGMIGMLIKGAHKAEIGYVLAKDCWGKGYAAEALECLLKEAWHDPLMHRIAAFCDVENKASARVMEKVGMEYEGRLRRYLILPNLSKIPRDALCYAILRPLN